MRAAVRRGISAAGLIAALAFAASCGRASREADAPGRKGAPPAAEPAAGAAGAAYAGSSVCAECHREEAALWRESDHALAMQEATPATILGDFGDRRVTAQGVTSTFTRRDGGFAVRTDGADGRLAEFKVAYAFGVRPLQQYLIEFPRGRYQALGLAWDSRPRALGGQRWFHLYAGERVDHRDALHWTSPEQNWNYMCAECHSTDLRRRYDAAGDRYATTWAEIDVACEACHGPGSSHVAWARAGARGPGGPGLAVRFPPLDPSAWVFDIAHPTARRAAPAAPGAPPSTGAPDRAAAAASDAALETCGRCHSRRGWVWEEVMPGDPLAQTHRVVALDADLYYDDGQILGEVYEYGSFLQSRMQRSGVTCSDCHDPHSGRLRAAGNALCSRCHQPSHFDAPAHHHHPAGSAGAQCVACHMPARV
jgi:predicted CXXCH cytochrome family protein